MSSQIHDKQLAKTEIAGIYCKYDVVLAVAVYWLFHKTCKHDDDIKTMQNSKPKPKCPNAEMSKSTQPSGLRRLSVRAFKGRASLQIRNFLYSTTGIVHCHLEIGSSSSSLESIVVEYLMRIYCCLIDWEVNSWIPLLCAWSLDTAATQLTFNSHNTKIRPYIHGRQIGETAMNTLTGNGAQ